MIQQTNQQQHPYYDHSIDVDNAAEMNSTSTRTISAGSGRTPFTEKLFQMLTHIDLYEPDLASIVSWQPHGRCFLVRDVKRFEENILPRFFKMTKYTSFHRQLNLWGFKRPVQRRHTMVHTTTSSAFAASRSCFVILSEISSD